MIERPGFLVNVSRSPFVRNRRRAERGCCDLGCDAHLVHHITADSNPPSWIRVQNKRIPHIVFSLPSLPFQQRVPYPSPSEPPRLPSSVDPHLGEATALCGGILCDATRIHSILDTFFQARVSSDGKMRRIQERISAKRMQSKTTSQYLLRANGRE
ncbi:hypothetical protein EDB89DRAFT_1296102 [Lactarius sanguifluus]|nr:hypothetical protein EDB89DRAFT_1296102 [Lactarius sanguifluus]